MAYNGMVTFLKDLLIKKVNFQLKLVEQLKIMTILLMGSLKMENYMDSWDMFGTLKARFLALTIQHHTIKDSKLEMYASLIKMVKKSDCFLWNILIE